MCIVQRRQTAFNPLIRAMTALAETCSNQEKESQLPVVYGAIEFSGMGELGQMRGDLQCAFAALLRRCAPPTWRLTYRMKTLGWTKLIGQQGFLPERSFAFMTLAVLANSKEFDYTAASCHGSDLLMAHSGTKGWPP